jgi:hypothetical protein
VNTSGDEPPPFSDEQVDIIAQVIADIRQETREMIADAVADAVAPLRERVAALEGLHERIARDARRHESHVRVERSDQKAEGAAMKGVILNTATAAEVQVGMALGRQRALADTDETITQLTEQLRDARDELQRTRDECQARIESARERFIKEAMAIRQQLIDALMGDTSVARDPRAGQCRARSYTEAELTMCANTNLTVSGEIARPSGGGGRAEKCQLGFLRPRSR